MDLARLDVVNAAPGCQTVARGSSGAIDGQRRDSRDTACQPGAEVGPSRSEAHSRLHAQNRESQSKRTV